MKKIIIDGVEVYSLDGDLWFSQENTVACIDSSTVHISLDNRLKEKGFKISSDFLEKLKNQLRETPLVA
jgi:hypothetical protein